MNRALLPLAVFLCLAPVIAAAPAGSTKYTLPDGPGKELVERTCTPCHGLENVVRSRKTAKEWSSVVDDMASRGAQGTDEELDQITEYLAKNFGPNSPVPATSTASGKVSINTASAADLVSALDISKADADAIVAYRTAHGPFHVIQDLKQVPGIDAKKIEAAQSKIDFHS